MKYKLLVVSALFFTVSGYFLGVSFNNVTNTSVLVVVLSCLNIFFITIMLLAFKMIRNQHLKGVKAGYKEGVEDIMYGVYKEYGEKGADKVAKAAKEIIQKDKKETSKLNTMRVRMRY